MTARVLVLGLGNALMGDDGVGAAVVDRLRDRVPISASARIVAAEDVLALLRIWNGERHVWFVDAVDSGAEPGTIHCFQHEEIFELVGDHFSAHGLSLVQCLRWMLVSVPKLRAARFRLWGVEPEKIAPREQLSTVVETSISRLSDELIRALESV